MHATVPVGVTVPDAERDFVGVDVLLLLLRCEVSVRSFSFFCLTYSVGSNRGLLGAEEGLVGGLLEVPAAVTWHAMSQQSDSIPGVRRTTIYTHVKCLEHKQQSLATQTRCHH